MSDTYISIDESIAKNFQMSVEKYLKLKRRESEIEMEWREAKRNNSNIVSSKWISNIGYDDILNDTNL